MFIKNMQIITSEISFVLQLKVYKQFVEFQNNQRNLNRVKFNKNIYSTFQYNAL